MPLGLKLRAAYIEPMAEIVNLKRARKTRQRETEAAQAGENRMAFGRSKAEKKLTKAEKQAAERQLEGHKRDGQQRNDDA